MEVKLLEPYGYCFGVKNGLKQLENIKKLYPKYKIHILGPFVHNRFTNDLLIKEGFVIFASTNKEDQINYIKTLNKDEDIVIFALHGYYKEVLDLIIENKIIYFDICCKFVKHNLDVVKNNKDNNYFIIGDENHIEIKYLLSFLSNNYVVNDYNKLDKNEKYIVLNQTTMDVPTYNTYIKNIKANVICKEKNICIEPLKRYTIFKEHLLNNTYDFVFIIGDKASANTNNLLNIYYLSTKNTNIDIFTTLEEVKSKVLKNIKKALVLSGTSSDDKVILSIYNYLKTI